jgi:hypothetical protein
MGTPGPAALRTATPQGLSTAAARTGPVHSPSRRALLKRRRRVVAPDRPPRARPCSQVLTSDRAALPGAFTRPVAPDQHARRDPPSRAARSAGALRARTLYGGQGVLGAALSRRVFRRQVLESFHRHRPRELARRLLPTPVAPLRALVGSPTQSHPSTSAFAHVRAFQRRNARAEVSLGLRSIPSATPTLSRGPTLMPSPLIRCGYLERPCCSRGDEPTPSGTRLHHSATSDRRWTSCCRPCDGS